MAKAGLIFGEYGGSQVKYEPFIQNPTATINVGFEPTVLVGSFVYNGSDNMTFVYDKSFSTTKYRRYYQGSVSEINLGADTTGLYQITSTGFTLNSTYLSAVHYLTYVAYK